MGKEMTNAYHVQSGEWSEKKKGPTLSRKEYEKGEGRVAN